MSVERFDAAALLIVEMQNDLVAPQMCEREGARGALARAVARRGVIPAIAGAAEACRARGIPVIYATKERHPLIPQPDSPPIYATVGAEPKLVAGTWGAQIVDALAPTPADLVLARYTAIDPSHASGLWSMCARLRVTTLIVAGVSTNFAVEGVVRAAVNRDIRAVVLEDCCASVPDEWHTFSATKILPLLARVLPSGDLLTTLEPPK